MRRMGFVLSVLLVAIAAAGCLSPQATQDDAAQVGAVAAQFVEGIVDDELSGVGDLLVYPFNLLFDGEMLTFQNKEQVEEYISFGYQYGTLLSHDVTITNVISQGTYGSAIVTGTFEMYDEEEDEEWTEIVVFDIKLTRSGNKWKITMVEVVAIGYDDFPILVANQ